MDVTIKKVGENDGGERFVLIDAVTRKVLTVHDTSEQALRRFFQQRGVAATTVDQSLERARQRYGTNSEPEPAIDHAADTADDDLLSGLGLDDDF